MWKPTVYCAHVLRCGWGGIPAKGDGLSPTPIHLPGWGRSLKYIVITHWTSIKAAELGLGWDMTKRKTEMPIIIEGERKEGVMK